MSIFGFQEATAVAAFGAFVFSQILRSFPKNNKWYKQEKPTWAPNAVVFPIVWTILYAGLTLTAFYFFTNTPPDSWQFIVGFVMFFVHVIANKMWSVVFWKYKNPSLAFSIILLLIATAVVWLVASIVGQTGLYYVPVIVIPVMITWLLFAAGLNLHWVKLYSEDYETI